METPQQRCARLVAALEDLVDQEVASVRMDDFETVAALQQRAAPIVAELATHGPARISGTVRSRLATVVERREKGVLQMQRRLDDTRKRLEQLDQSSRRAAQIAPVYGQSLPSKAQLRAIG